MVAVVTFGEFYCFVAGVFLTYVFMVTKNIDKEETKKKPESKTKRHKVNGFIRK